MAQPPAANPVSEPHSLVAPSPDRVFERVFALLRDQIVAGALKPGDRLLAERELAQRLNVSRASLREALRAMEMLGLVEIRACQGTFIQRPGLRVLQDFFGVALSLGGADMGDIVEARMAIECQAIRLACRRATPEDLARIRAALERLRATVADVGLGGDADCDFHTAVVRASHNETLLSVYEALQALLRRSHRDRRAVAKELEGFLDELGDAHETIYRAIVAGDEDTAEREMRRHFYLAQDYRTPGAGEGAPSPSTD